MSNCNTLKEKDLLDLYTKQCEEKQDNCTK